MEVWIWVWVAIIIISLYLEFITMELVTIWITIGAIIALIISAIGIGAEVQVIVFFVISFMLILTLRKWAKNKLLNSSSNTNLDLIKSQKYKLISEIKDDNNVKGTIKYSGIIWTAVSDDGSDIPAGAFVNVVQIKGNRLIVKKEEQQ